MSKRVSIVWFSAGVLTMALLGAVEQEGPAHDWLTMERPHYRLHHVEDIAADAERIDALLVVERELAVDVQGFFDGWQAWREKARWGR